MVQLIILRIAARERATADKEVVAAHKGVLSRARKVGSTPDIDTSHAMLVDMVDTVPVLSGKRTRGTDAHFWVPVKGAQVRVFWAGVGGEGEHMKVPGTWHPATVSTMEWPEDRGEPGLYLKYAADGFEEWTAISLFGDTVLPIESTKKMKPNVNIKKRKQDQVEYTEHFPKEATEWLGYGAQVKVKWGSKWIPGTVVGREPGGIMVKYEGRKQDSIGVHPDLHTRGCRIKVFRRRVNLDRRCE